MLVWIFVFITIFSVFLGLKLQRKRLFALPLLAIAVFMLIEIIKVPLPLWDTITFIFDLKG
ncbi:hypothetical protein E2R51_10420 [Jeotgalibacillus sp. S-D1]|uniref:hypothetical protein n=1 Tax=Jeotgalibacillus sp. S-D1 TaxID=2552189 RepID=UPI001059EA28|nr:hypothetical protein [Jeotgalibacillus sp. S-D1]TDL33062.1 hypothetical protein E2R51_10420 [Jeotgalibacillus sp. S-D1]